MREIKTDIGEQQARKRNPWPEVGPYFDPYPAGRCFTRRQILTSNTSTATYHAALSSMSGMKSIDM
jgi:hypothetical protein